MADRTRGANGFLVNIERVSEAQLAAWAERYPAEFNRDYDPDGGVVATARVVRG